LTDLDDAETPWAEVSLSVQRARTYVALFRLADGQWATAAQLEEFATEDAGDPKFGAYLDGMVCLSELEVVEKDGLKLFRLTSFGRSFGQGVVLSEMP
jgi:hypothetical protein